VTGIVRSPSSGVVDQQLGLDRRTDRRSRRACGRIVALLDDLVRQRRVAGTIWKLSRSIRDRLAAASSPGRSRRSGTGRGRCRSALSVARIGALSRVLARFDPTDRAEYQRVM
jgi:hypothetical protein